MAWLAYCKYQAANILTISLLIKFHLFYLAKVPTELKKELVAMLKDALQKELEGTKLNPKWTPEFLSHIFLNFLPHYLHCSKIKSR